MPDEPRGQAEVVIPQAWLLPNLSLDAVRALQRGDTTSDLERGDLRLAGIEVLVARNWVKEEFWPRIQDAVQKGYAAEKTYTFLRAHADRRRVQQKAEHQPPGEPFDISNPHQDAGDQHQGRPGVDHGELDPPRQLVQGLLRCIGGPGGHRAQ